MKNNYTIKEIVNKVREHISSHFIPQSETTETKLKMFQDSLAYDHTFIEKNMNGFGTLDKVDKTLYFKTYPTTDSISAYRKEFREALIREDQEDTIFTEVDHDDKEIIIKKDFDTIVKAIGNGLANINDYKKNINRIRDTRYLLNQEGIMSERLCRLALLTRRNEMLCIKLTTLKIFKRHGFSSLTDELLKGYPPEVADPFNKSFILSLLLDMAYSNLDSLRIAETLEMVNIGYENKKEELGKLEELAGNFVIGKDNPIFEDMNEYIDTAIEYYTDQMYKLTYDMINDNLVVFDYSNFPIEPIEESHEHHHHHRECCGDHCNCHHE